LPLVKKTATLAPRRQTGRGDDMGKFNPQAAMELQQLVSEYWGELDSNQARNVTDFYLEDCSFTAGTTYSGKGRAGVRKFYDERAKFVSEEKDGIRTTRHTYANFKVAFENDNSARVDFVMINYSGSGAPPIAGFTGPSMVSDVTFECRRDAQGQWKIAAFMGTPMFVTQEGFAEKFLAKARALA
jgi:ketosteroid isomerase-like protein